MKPTKFKLKLLPLPLIFLISGICSAGDMYVDVDKEILRSNKFIIVSIEEGARLNSSSNSTYYRGVISSDEAKYSGKAVCLIGSGGLKVGAKYFLATYTFTGMNVEKNKCKKNDEVFEIGASFLVAFEVVRRSNGSYVKFDNMNYIYPVINGIIRYSAPVSISAHRFGDTHDGGIYVTSLVPYNIFYTYLREQKKLE